MGLNISVKDLINENDENSKMTERIEKELSDGEKEEKKVRDVDEESEEEEEDDDNGEPTKIGLIKINTKKLDYIPV
jgi:hypothetical protein